jgi:hypothetical protein
MFQIVQHKVLGKLFHVGMVHLAVVVAQLKEIAEVHGCSG